MRLPPAGEQVALGRWSAFRDGGLDAYEQRRDRPDLAGTSGLSAALRWGEVHPRTLLADLGDGTGRGRLPPGAGLARVLRRRPPPPARVGPQLAAPRARALGRHGRRRGARFAAWCAGRTGYPFVDAGMRQLRAEGWVHNRVRMVVASFLVKDLHLDWTRGARVVHALAA